MCYHILYLAKTNSVLDNYANFTIMKTKPTYDCFECFVAHVASVRPVIAVHLEMFPDVGDALEEFATFPTLVLTFSRVHRQMFVQSVLCRECLPT